MTNWLTNLQEAFNNLVSKLETWLNDIIVNIPNFFLAAIVLGLGVVGSRYVNRYVLKVINRFSTNRSVNKLLASILTTLFLLVVLFIVLGILKLDTALQSLLAGAGVAGLAVGLALQDPIINLFSGVMMSTRQSFKLGDLIETNGYFGIIQNITLRGTTIKTLDGQEVILPNKTVYQEALKNYSNSGERRVVVNCGVSYGDDLEQASKIAQEAVTSSVTYNRERGVELFFTEFGDSSINFVLRFWLTEIGQADYLRAQHQAIIAIKKAFDQHDITIPFPIRTLDFGVEGGLPLSEALPIDRWTGSSEN